jgi:hypothetical protein
MGERNGWETIAREMVSRQQRFGLFHEPATPQLFFMRRVRAAELLVLSDEVTGHLAGQSRSPSSMSAYGDTGIL